MRTFVSFALAATAISTAFAACTDNTHSVDDLQNLLQQGGAGYTLSLCAGQTYTLDKILNYTAASQEISTEGYPQDNTRATLLINGFNQTTAVQANSVGMDYSKLRNVQINGNRDGANIYIGSGANIEFGGQNNGQLIEYVRSWDPRGWSCMHIQEGPFKCRNVTIQNNDLGPCGSEQFQQWADGISFSCQSGLVQNNDIVDATDGGIVIFGSPNTTVRNNTIHVKTRTLLGGINMVDVEVWKPEGNFSHVIVEENTIMGGYATSVGNSTYGPNNASAIIKVGIAIGPKTWWSDGRYGTNKTTGAIVRDNRFSGAFAYAIGLSSAENFLVQNNTFFGNLSFIGTYGPNCTTGSETPHPPVALLEEQPSLDNVTIDLGIVPDEIARAHNGTRGFVNGTTNGLICMMPPPSNDFSWPYGGGGVNAETSGTTTATTTTSEGPILTSQSGTSSSPATSSATSSHGAAGRSLQLDPSVFAGLGLLVLGIMAGAATL